jgi:hypothetical protein
MHLIGQYSVYIFLVMGVDVHAAMQSFGLGA